MITENNITATEPSRLDHLICQIMNFSREHTKNVIQNGDILVNNKSVVKPSHKLKQGDIITVNATKLAYVSRGGYKLEKALECFSIDINNKVCLDIGASTGGFTDCLIQKNAKIVFAVDSGQNQLAQSLTENKKVVSFEKTKIQDFCEAFKTSNNEQNFLTPYNEILSNTFDFICVDVSFVSVCKIMSQISSLMNDNSHAVLLIKPQFEAGKENVNKSGIIKDIKLHKKVIANIYKSVTENNLLAINLTFSPIKGGSGNIEYLIHCSKNNQNVENTQFYNLIDIITISAFENLN